MSKIFFLFATIIFAALMFSNTVSASSDVVVSGVAVNAVLNADRTINVTETYTAYIHNPVESITMTLPLTQTVTRQTAAGSEETTVTAEYADISLYDRHVSSTVEGDNLVITTQGAGFESGAVQIPLVYTFDPGQDNTIGADEFFFRPVRSARETSMGSFSIVFTFPSEVSAESILLTDTVSGSVLEFTLSGNVLTGYNLASIPPEGDVLLQVSMQDGYFIGGLSTEEEEVEFTFNNLVYGICFTVMGLILLLNILLRIRRMIKPIPSTYPPQDFSPAELYHLLRSEPSRRSVLSSFVSLAIKGYVNISFDDTGLLITKTLNHDSDLPPLQCELMMSAFAAQEVFLLDKESLISLTNEFSRSAQRSLAKSAELESSVVFGLCISMLLLLGVVAGILTGLYHGIETGMTSMLIVATSVGGPFALGGLMMRSGFSAMRQKRPAVMFFIGLSIIAFALCLGIMTSLSGVDPIFGSIAMAAVAFLMVFTASLHRRSGYSTEIMAQTEALNRFIATPDRNRLAELTAQDSDYLLNILPHAICFGNELQLIKAFEENGLQVPHAEQLPPIKELCELLPGNS